VFLMLRVADRFQQVVEPRYTATVFGRPHRSPATQAEYPSSTEHVVKEVSDRLGVESPSGEADVPVRPHEDEHFSGDAIETMGVLALSINTRSEVVAMAERAIPYPCTVLS
jgi:hypothetical protein